MSAVCTARNKIPLLRRVLRVRINVCEYVHTRIIMFIRDDGVRVCGVCDARRRCGSPLSTVSPNCLEHDCCVSRGRATRGTRYLTTADASSLARIIIMRDDHRTVDDNCMTR